MTIFINKIIKKFKSIIKTKQNDISSFMDTNNMMMLNCLHKDKKCFILGNGPSLNLTDIELIRNEYTFASNKIYMLFEDTTWRPSFYNVEDVLVGTQNVEDIEKVDNTIKFFPYYLIQKTGRRFKNAIYYHSTAKSIDDSDFPGFSNNPIKNLFWGSTVIYIQIQLAVYMGFTEIYLLGVDYSYTEPKLKKGNVLISEGEINHFHKDYRKPGEKWFIPNLDVQNKTFSQIENIYSKQYGFKIYNATRGGKLEIFERINLEKAIYNK